jgi:antitoxin VapB
MGHTTIFRSNRSQAVRLPKDVAFPDEVKQVTVLRDGKRRIIVPTGSLWDEFFDSPGIDLGPREQPPVQSRESL